MVLIPPLFLLKRIKRLYLKTNDYPITETCSTNAGLGI